MEFNSEKTERAAILVNRYFMIFGLIWGLYLRLKLFLVDRSLWVDPAMLALNIIKKGYGELLGQLDLNQSAPPAFLWVSKWIGSQFQYNEWSLRLFPFIMGISALVLFYKISHLWLGNRCAFLAFIPFSFSTTVIFYSAEFKQYTTDLFFALLLLWLITLFIDRSYRKKYLWWLLWTGLVSIWFSHTAVFILGGIGCVLLYHMFFEKKLPAGHKVFISFICGIWMLQFLGCYLLIFSQSVGEAMYRYHRGGFAPFPVDSKADLVWYGQTLKGLFYFPLGLERLYLWPLAGLIAGIVRGFRLRMNWGKILILVSPLFLVYAASVLRKYPVSTGHYETKPRLILFLVPFLYLLIARGIHYLSGIAGSIVVYGLGVTLFMVSPVTHAVVPRSYLSQETKPLIEYYQNHMESGDRIYVFYATVPAFRYYTRATDAPFYTHDFSPEDLDGYFRDLDSLKMENRVWFLFSHISKKDLQTIVSYLQRSAKLLDIRYTTGAELFLFEFRPRE